MGVPEVMLAIMFHTHWGNIRLTCCFRGVAPGHAFCCALHALWQYQSNELLLWDRPNLCDLYHVFHALGQYQTNEVLLWDRPNSCFLWRFISFGAISD